METYRFCISSSLMLLFGLDGGYTFLVGTAQGLVSGIVHHCASYGKCVCAYGFEFLHDGGFRRRDRYGFRFGSGNYSRGLRQQLQKNVLLGAILYGISTAETKEPGWSKGCYSAACKQIPRRDFYRSSYCLSPAADVASSHL
jgi:hypothetical protein